MEHKDFSVTREKHLDHMVKVVPFIVTAYAIQCYFIMHMGADGFAVNGLFFLGACLVSMIASFIAYDLTHMVKFEEETLFISVKWLGYRKELKYSDIIEIKITEPSQTFSTLILHTASGKKYGFYFVDDADKIKSWLEQKRTPELQAAA